MRCLFLTEGGKNIGFGHITRCLALSEGLSDKNIKSEFIVRGDTSVTPLLKEVKHSNFDWIKGQERVFWKIKEADFVIIDSYKADRKFYDAVSLLKKGNLLMIDDYKRMNYPPGIVVNPSIYGEKLKYPKRRGVKYLLGKKYVILRKEFWNVPDKKINAEIKDIMITFGGSASPLFIKKIQSFLKSQIDAKVHIVNPSKQRLSAKNMLNLMLKSDLYISGGGQTTYELARVGVPTIGVCFADNQIFNLKYWAKKGFIKYAGWYDDKNLNLKLAKNLSKLSDFETRSKIHALCKKNIDELGVKRVVKEIVSFIIKKEVVVRNIKPKDIWEIYKISNDPEVRKKSFNSAFISPKDHSIWFSRVDKKNFYVALFKNKIIAQVRFSEKYQESVVSISLDKSFRGLGISNFLLSKIINKYLSTQEKTRQIFAYIKKGNFSSVNLFERCGFVRIGVEKIAGFSAFKYLYEKK